MAEEMKKVAMAGQPLSFVELGELHIAYHKQLKPLRQQYRALDEESKELEEEAAVKKKEEERDAVAEKIVPIARELSDLLDGHVIPRMPAGDVEGRVVALRMKADAHRYVAETYWGEDRWSEFLQFRHSHSTHA